MKTPFIAILSSLIILASCSKNTNTLLIYSIEHEEETLALCNLFTQETGIKIKYLRASTGELVNRVLNEKKSPLADVLLGGATNYHIMLDENGCLAQYKPGGASYLSNFQKSQNDTWHAFCVITLAIGVNGARYKKLYGDKAMPKTWEDLLDPDYKKELVIPNPRNSSTAYLFLQNQLQRLGDDKGYEYLSKFEKQVAQFPNTGDAPIKLVGTGEYAIAVGFLNAFAKWREQGFDLQYVSPPKTACDMDCVSIMQNCKHKEFAQKFVDFMMGENAQRCFSGISKTVSINPNVHEGTININDIDMLIIDNKKSTQEKDAVLKKWDAICNN